MTDSRPFIFVAGLAVKRAIDDLDRPLSPRFSYRDRQSAVEFLQSEFAKAAISALGGDESHLAKLVQQKLGG